MVSAVRFPGRGWLGAGLMLLAGGTAAGWLSFGAPGLAQPLFWTGAILALDAGAQAAGRRSFVSGETPAFVWAATLSILVLAVIEVLNSRQPVWSWLGWPANELARYGALGWHFATALPWAVVAGGLFANRRLADSGAGGRGAWLRIAVGVALLGGAWLVREGSSAAWFGTGLLGLLLCGDGLSMLQDRASLFRNPTLFAGLATASLARYALETAFQPPHAAGRFFVAPEGPGVLDWVVGALLGPAIFALYLAAASQADLPVWSVVALRRADKEDIKIFGDA